MAWRAADGKLYPARCGASNRCAYCAWLISVENSLVVGMDARERQPTVGMTLTTHRPDFDMVRFRWATAKVFRWFREQGHGVEYCGLMEWTTGKGGHGRMPHMHALVKGLDPALAQPLEPELSALWKRLTAGAWVVDLRELRTPGGAIAYMVGHHHKREQAPPPSFKGKRMRPSKGYFEQPVGELRETAKRAVQANVREKAALRELERFDVEEHDRTDLLEAILWDVENQPPATLVRIDHLGREVEPVPVNHKRTDRAPRWRSWVTVGAPYA